MLCTVKLGEILLTCDQGNFNGTTARNRNGTLVTGRKREMHYHRAEVRRALNANLTSAHTWSRYGLKGVFSILSRWQAADHGSKCFSFDSSTISVILSCKGEGGYRKSYEGALEVRLDRRRRKRWQKERYATRWRGGKGRWGIAERKEEKEHGRAEKRGKM